MSLQQRNANTLANTLYTLYYIHFIHYIHHIAMDNIRPFRCHNRSQTLALKTHKTRVLLESVWSEILIKATIQIFG